MSTAGACVSKCTQVHEYYSSQSPKTRSLSTDRCLCSSASHMPPKRKGRAQPRLDVPKYKLLRQPMSLLGTQVKFPGSFWEGRKFTTEDGLLNEFAMMWALRNKFPLHYVLFKQTACHLPREANVEQIFSRALGCWQTPTSTRPTSLCWSGLASTRRPSSRQWQRSRRSTTSCSEAKGASTRRAPRARPVRHLHRRPGRPGRLRRRMPPPWHREYLAAVPCIVCGSVCVF
jgi:hypothetical protein